MINKDLMSLDNSDGTKVTSKAAKLDVIFNANIPLDKICIYAEFTRLQDKILLLCDDESVMLFNIEQVRANLSFGFC